MSETPGPGAAPSSEATVRCAACGHVLFDVRPDTRCRRCGLPALASQSLADQRLGIDAGGVVQADAACRKCGYNLRGLRGDGQCPECGTAVAVSLRRDLLCFEEPAHIRRLARGNRWVARGLVGIVVSAVAMIFVGIGAAFWSDLWWVLDLALSVMIFAVPAAGIISFGLCLIGVWMVTAPRRVAFGTQSGDGGRRWVRLLLGFSVAGYVLDQIVEYANPPVRIMAAFALVALTYNVAVVIAIAAYFRYVRRLASRIPDDGLAKRAGDLGRNLAIAVGVLVAFGAVGTVALWGPVLVTPTATTTAPAATPPALLGDPWQRWEVFQSCVSTVAFLAALVLFIRAVNLHRALKRPLLQQAELAAELWRKVDSPLAEL